MNFIKKWIAKVAYEGTAQPREMQVNKLHDMFSNNMAAMVAFKIDNGYVVRCMNPDAVLGGERLPGFMYCADHQAIADHIVASAMRDKLGVQPDMFEKEKQAGIQYSRKQVTITPRSNTITAQSSQPFGY